MPDRFAAAPVAVFLLLLAAAGCLNPATPTTSIGSEWEDLTAGLVRGRDVLLVDHASRPVPYAQARAILADGGAALFSANATGVLDFSRLPSEASKIMVWTPGREVETFGVADARLVVRLHDAVGTKPVPDGFLAFDAPVELPCGDYPDTAIKRAVAEAGSYNLCGGGEPVIEVRSDGTVVYSTTLLIYATPPVWISYDQGETWSLFRQLGTGLTREAIGTENEFAFDDAGNLYIFDMQGGDGGGWFSNYRNADQHQFTVPFPFYPMTVDRPYVKAGPEPGRVWVIYNDAQIRPRTTYLHESQDGGLTWTLLREFPCANLLGQGTTRNDLMIVGAYGCSPDQDNTHADIRFWITQDGARTWKGPEIVPFPEGSFKYRGNWIVYNPVADEAGNVYLAYSHSVQESGEDLGIFLARRSPEGTWEGPWDIGMRGTNVLPWISAGREGHLGITFYHNDAGAFEELQQGTQWFMWAGATVTAHTASPTFQLAQAEPRKVYDGPGMYHATQPGGSEGGLDRHGTAFLADFTANEILPDGRLAIGYSRSETSEHLRSFPQFARSVATIDLGRQGGYFNGP